MITRSGEIRKTVTVLFADISGSTALGERLDPESVRALLARHFADARTILERHGGTVEKFIGDAVMAVFGVPVVHEDDALRAVRAALELQHSMSTAADARAPRLSIRIGVNTGEVVTGIAGETLVTGDAVNVAARLEQQAAPGDILVGATTYDLVRDAVDATPVGPIEAKGKTAPVPAYLVRAVVGEEGRRRLAAGAFVGRTTELAVLQHAWDARVERPQLVTIVAPAGVGKSRLIAEFAASLRGSAVVAKGRCLSYGDGITYWPIREMVHQLADIDEGDSTEHARAKLDTVVPGAPEVAGPVAAAIGLDAQAVHKEDLFWAVRRLFESACERDPLILLVEDLHWAEETMLDLIEYLVEMSAAPIMILATARPELLATRPAWSSAAGSLLRLETLGSDASAELLMAQAGAAALPGDARDRILEAADGNALFLEELVAMLRDRSALRHDGVQWRLAAPVEGLDIPPSIQALLAARLDQLHEEERAVAQHGSVIGRSFEAAAVAEIAPEAVRSDLTRRLLALVRKELLRPDRAELTDGDAFRFRHILIRDAAYTALPKAERAVLHERVAGWLERAAGERIGEFEEIVAHHLEQAVVYRRELGDADLGALSERAARRMLESGLRAANRDDTQAAVRLLRKAAALGAGIYEVESVALRELGELLQDSGAFVETEQIVDRALEIAIAAGNEREAAYARLNRLYVHRHTQPATWVAEAERTIPEAIAAFERAGDAAGLAAAWHARALAAWPDIDAMTQAEQQALVHARSSGDPRWLGWIIGSLSGTVISSRTPVMEGLEVLANAAQEVAGLGSLFRASVALDQAVLEAMRGRYAEALEMADAARATFRQFGHRMELALSASAITMIHLYGDRPDRAEAPLRETIEFLATTGDRDLGPYLAAMLARFLAILDRHDEARALADGADIDDADPARDVLLNGARARIAASTGHFETAINHAEEAVRLSPPNVLNRRVLALMDLGHVLAAAERTAEARSALREALQLTEVKGNVALGAIIGRQLAALAEDEQALP